MLPFPDMVILKVADSPVFNERLSISASIEKSPTRAEKGILFEKLEG